MMKSVILAATVLAMATAEAAADPIVGQWRTQSGATAEIAPCDGGFCITLRSGQHAGKLIGTFQGDGASGYRGRITDPSDDRTYAGSATLTGSMLNMKGCALKIFCRTQTWSRP